jgi:hypothetical protein
MSNKSEVGLSSNNATDVVSDCYAMQMILSFLLCVYATARFCRRHEEESKDNDDRSCLLGFFVRTSDLVFFGDYFSDPVGWVFWSSS